MPTTMQYIGGKEGTLNTATTRYWAPTSGNQMVTFTATESVSLASTERALTFSKLYVYLKTNTKTTSNPTITFRNNGANGNITISIPFGSTGIFSNTANTDVVAAGSTFTLACAYNSGTGTLVFSNFSIVADYTGTESIAIFQCSPGATFSGTAYVPIAGYSAGNATEAQAQVKLPKAGVIRNGVWRITSNSRDGDSTLTLRLNGVDTTLVVTALDSTTGTFKDTTHSVTIAADDLVCWKSIRGGSGGGISQASAQCEFETTSDTFPVTCEQSVTLAPGGATSYYQYIGGETPSTYTDTDTKVDFNLSGYSADNLRVYVQTNTIASTTNMYLRKNGSDTAVTVAITASTTGHFSDTTNSVSISSGDDLNYRVAAGGSGSLLIRRATLNFTKDTVVLSSNNDNMFFSFI